MIPLFRKRQRVMTEKDWSDLLYTSQLNILALANITLTIIEDPQCVTDETRDLMISYVKDLEYGVARMEEYRV